MEDLAGKLVVVTGGTSGIGGEIVRLAAGRGARVVLSYAEKADAAREMVNSGLVVAAPRLLLGNVDSTRGFLDEVTRQGKVDYFVANAGREFSGGLEKHEWPKIDDVVTADLTGNLYLLQGLIVGGLMNQGGQISVVGSIAADGNHDQFAYSAAKAGLRGAIESLSRYDAMVRGQGLGVKLLEPAFVNTGMTARILPILRRKVVKPDLLDEFNSKLVMELPYAAGRILELTTDPEITGVRTIPEGLDLHDVRKKYFKG